MPTLRDRDEQPSQSALVAPWRELDQLAHLLGKPQSFNSAYESGQRRVDVLEMLKILEALGADPEKVFKGIVEKVRDGKRPSPRRQRS